jgi:hypothetical protein
LQERTVGFTASRVRAVVPPEVFVTDVRNVSLDACFIATKVQRQDSSNGWQLRRSFYTADQVRYILLRTPQHILLKGTQLKKAMVMKDTSTSDLFDQTVESTAHKPVRAVQRIHLEDASKIGPKQWAISCVERHIDTLL